jgi:hypothetical protein
MTGKMLIDDCSVCGLAADRFLRGGKGSFTQLLLFIDWVCVAVLLRSGRTEKPFTGKSICTAIYHTLKHIQCIIIGRLNVCVFSLLLFFLTRPLCILFLSLITARNKKLIAV